MTKVHLWQGTSTSCTPFWILFFFSPLQGRFPPSLSGILPNQDSPAWAKGVYTTPEIHFLKTTHTQPRKKKTPVTIRKQNGQPDSPDRTPHQTIHLAIPPFVQKQKARKLLTDREKGAAANNPSQQPCGQNKTQYALEIKSPSLDHTYFSIHTHTYTPTHIYYTHAQSYNIFFSFSASNTPFFPQKNGLSHGLSNRKELIVSYQILSSRSKEILCIE